MLFICCGFSDISGMIPSHVHYLNFVIITCDDVSRDVIRSTFGHVEGVSVGMKANILLIKL